MQLFLTAEAKGVVKDISSKIDLKKGKKLAFINSAAEPKMNSDISWLHLDRQAFVESGFEVTDFTITNKSKLQILEFLDPFDFIYCSGGSAPYLLEQSYRSGFIDVVRDLVRNQNKIYIGTSGGSVITGPKLPDYLLDESNQDLLNKDAFGFVNFSVIPHWGDEHFKNRWLNDRLKKVYDENQNPFIILANHQYIHIKDDWLKIYSV